MPYSNRPIATTNPIRIRASDLFPIARIASVIEATGRVDSYNPRDDWLDTYLGTVAYR